MTTKPTGEVASPDVVLTRLEAVEQQIGEIRKLLQQGGPCLPTLRALAGTEATLHRIGVEVFEHHVQHCLTPALTRSDEERQRQVDELVLIFERFAR